MWSFGIVVWEIFTLGNTPYPGMSNQEVASKVIHGYKLEVSHLNCDEKWKKIMNRCWVTKPENRPSFAMLQSEVEPQLYKHGSKKLELATTSIQGAYVV